MEETIDLREHFLIIKKRGWIILLITLIVNAEQKGGGSLLKGV